MRERLLRALPFLLPMAVVLPFSLRAIALDTTPSDPSNAITGQVATAVQALAQGDWRDAGSALTSDRNPPLSILLVSLLTLLLGPSLAAARLGGLLCHGVLIWQTHDLARQAGAPARVSGLAALLCGASPMIFGWTRLTYADVYVPVFCAACLQVMMRGHLNRRRGLLLGLLAGLGALTKLTFLVSMLAPGLWFVAGHLGRRAWRHNLLLALALGLALFGWWPLAMWDVVASNFLSSTQAMLHTAPLTDQQTLVARKLSQAGFYLWELKGVTLLWGGALLGLWLCRRSAPRLPRSLLGLASVVTLALWMVFDADPRYLLAMIPPAAVLSALGLEQLLQRAPSPAATRARPWVEASLVAALLGWFGWLNLAHVTEDGWRFFRSGMLRPVPEYQQACQAVGAHRDALNVVYDDPFVAEWLRGLQLEAGRSCRFPEAATEASRPAPCTLQVTAVGKPPAPHPRIETAGRCPPLELLPRFGRRAYLQFFLHPWGTTPGPGPEWSERNYDP